MKLTKVFVFEWYFMRISSVVVAVLLSHLHMCCICAASEECILLDLWPNKHGRRSLLFAILPHTHTALLAQLVPILSFLHQIKKALI